MKNLLHSFKLMAELRGRWRAGALTIGTTF